MKHGAFVLSLCAGACVLGCHSESSKYGYHDAASYEPVGTSMDSSASAKASPSQLTPQKQVTEAGSSVLTDKLLPEDRQFIEQAAQGGMFEVESSRIATSKATSASVKEFANMMIEDHEITNRELESIARAKGMSAPTTLDPEHRQDLDELRDLSGPAFEAKFVAMQVAAQESAIQLFEWASQECADPELRAFAKKSLPTLRAHRTALEKIDVTRGPTIPGEE